jgi:hypothetical protein
MDTTKFSIEEQDMQDRKRQDMQEGDRAEAFPDE